MEIFVDGKVILMDDYKNASVTGLNHKSKTLWTSKNADKGQLEELKVLTCALKDGSSWPISLNELFCATRVSLDIDEQIRI